jgi:DNA-binding transcriptional LysR family regulator
VDRRTLEYFLAVAENGSFKNAAVALHVAQPSLSQAIQGLERELGVKLFYRLKHGSRLTAEGEALVEPARRTLRGFDDAAAAVVNVSALQGGRLDIVAQPHLAADPLPRLLAPFHARYPAVTVRIVDPESADVLDVVRAGKAEIGLDWWRPSDDDAVVTELPDAEVLLVLPPGTDDVEPVMPASYVGEVGLVIAVPLKFLRDYFEHAEVGLGGRVLARQRSPRIVVESGHHMALVPLVLAGMGGALVPEALARPAQALGAVTCRLDPPLRRPAFLVHIPPVHSAPAAAFLELVSELVAAETQSVTAGA